MRFQGARIKEQGQVFGIVVVKQSAISNSLTRGELVVTFSRKMGCPTVLAAQSANGRFTYYGDSNVVNFLKNVPPETIPWGWFED
jgi:hypothetical protein